MAPKSVRQSTKQFARSVMNVVSSFLCLDYSRPQREKQTVKVSPQETYAQKESRRRQNEYAAQNGLAPVKPPRSVELNVTPLRPSDKQDLGIIFGNFENVKTAVTLLPSEEHANWQFACQRKREEVHNGWTRVSHRRGREMEKKIRFDHQVNLERYEATLPRPTFVDPYKPGPKVATSVKQVKTRTPLIDYERMPDRECFCHARNVAGEWVPAYLLEPLSYDTVDAPWITLTTPTGGRRILHRGSSPRRNPELVQRIRFMIKLHQLRRRQRRAVVQTIPVEDGPIEECHEVPKTFVKTPHIFVTSPDGKQKRIVEAQSRPVDQPDGTCLMKPKKLPTQGDIKAFYDKLAQADQELEDDCERAGIDVDHVLEDIETELKNGASLEDAAGYATCPVISCEAQELLMEKILEYFKSHESEDLAHHEQFNVQPAVVVNDETYPLSPPISSSPVVWFAKLIEKSPVAHLSTSIWTDIIYRNPVTLSLWLFLWLFIGWFVSPAMATIALTATFATSVTSQFNHVLVSTIQETTLPAVREFKQTVTDTVSSSVDKVVDGLHRYTAIVDAEGISLKNLCSAINNHKMGVGANIMLLMQAQDMTSLSYGLISLFSLLGFEQSLINTFIAKLVGAASTSLGHSEQFGVDDIGATLQDVIGRHKTTFTMQRSMGIMALICTALGVNVSGKNPLKWVTEANTTRKSLEEIVSSLEEQFNLLGFISTGKYDYIKQLENQTENIRKEFEVINNQMSVAPAFFITPSGWRTWSKYRENVLVLERIMNKNTCADLKNSRLFMSFSTIINKMYTWDSEIAQIRGVTGKRVEPVGICITGPSQIGKSKLRSELTRRVCDLLERKAKMNSDLVNFIGASEWSTWNVQARDEYDQGYNGQQVTYVDDGFSDKTHKDHPMFLTFISGEAVGTVQANLNQKGMPYSSKIVIVSSNTLPEGSTTINNIEALQRRFPFTISAHLKPGYGRPSESAPYDPEFKHLHFHVGSMHEHCVLPKNNVDCGWKSGQVPLNNCKCKMMTLEQLVEAIAASCINRDEKFRTELKVFLQSQNICCDNVTVTPVTVDNVEFVPIVIPPMNQVTVAANELAHVEQADENAGAEHNAQRAGTLLPTPVPRAHLEGRRDVSAVILRSFRRAVIESVADVELLEATQWLRHKRTGQTVREWCAEQNVVSSYEFMLMLNLFDVSVNDQHAFKTAWVRLFGDGRRVRDDRLDIDYVYSMRLNAGSTMFGVPQINGVVENWDRTNPEHAIVMDMVDMANIEIVMLPDSDFSVFRVSNWGRTQGPTYSSTVIGLYVWGLMGQLVSDLASFGLVGWPVIIPCMLGLYMSVFNAFNYAINHFPRFAHIEESWFGQQARNNPVTIVRVTAQIAESVMHFWNRGVDQLKAAWSYVTGWVDSLQRQFAWVFYKLGGLLGLSLDQVYEQWSAVIADKLALATVTVAAAAILGVAYAIYKCLASISMSSTPELSANETRAWDKFAKVVKNESQEQAYDHVSRNRPARGVIKRVVNRPQLCNNFKEVYQQYHEQQNEKINYYVEDRPCPFCDASVYGKDGPVRDLGDYLQKINHTKKWDFDMVVFSKEHMAGDQMSSGNMAHEFETMCNAAEEAGCEFFAFEKNVGINSGGSVPHSHMKWYRNTTPECGWWHPADRFKQFVDEYGFVIDVYTTRGLANKRIIEIPFVCQYDFEKFDKLCESLRPLWASASVASWHLSGYVKEDWICGSFSLLTTSIAGSERGWTPSEVRNLHPIIDSLLGRKSQITDLLDPTLEYTYQVMESRLTAWSSNAVFKTNLVELQKTARDSNMTLRQYVEQQGFKSLIVCTGNPRKAEEFKKLMPGIALDFYPFAWDEVQGNSWDIVIKKAKDAWIHFERPVLVDDSALSLSALGDMPGPYIKDFILKIGAQGISDLCTKLGDNKATARTVLCFCNNNVVTVFESEVQGVIVPPSEELTRDNWDSIFSPDGESTYAMLPMETKPRAGAVKGLMSSTVLETAGISPAHKEQSSDDAALHLTRTIESKVGVVVMRAFRRSDPCCESDWDELDSFTGGAYSAGLACGSRILVPGHAARVGTWFKVFPLAVEGVLRPMNAGTWKSQVYCMARMVHRDDVRDIGVLELVAVQTARKLLAAMRGSPVHIPRAIGSNNYSSMLIDHVMYEKEWLATMSGTACVQYVPTEGLLCPGYATYVGKQSLLIVRSTGSVMEEKDLICVSGIETDVNTTQDGDCGGILLAMNPRCAKKVLGFHVLGTAINSKSVILTREILDSLNVYTPQISVSSEIIKPHPPLTTEAGQGYKQIKDWPQIDWAPQPLQMHECVKEGFPTDLPAGEDVIPLGVLTYDHVPAPIRSAPSDVLGFSTNVPMNTDWKRSPFFHAFPEEMVPSAMNPNDERIEVPLAKNALGKKSLLLEPNSVMGEKLPVPDCDILSLVFQDLLSEWNNIFNDCEIGCPSDLKSVLDIGLNGLPRGQFVRGMNLKASCGVPWNERPAEAQKSNLVSIDDEGVRSFNTACKGGNRLVAVSTMKLACAQRGLRQKSYCASKLKDCLVKKNHVKIGKTRVFNCSSIEDVIVGNGLFGPFKEAYMARARECNHAIGINVHSPEWTAVYDDLAHFPNWFDVDYKNFDKHLPSVFLRLGFKLMIDTIARKSGDAWKLARFTTAEAWVNSLMVDFRTVYMTEHSNKSGDVLTTVINSVVNSMFMLYCYYVLVGRDFASFRQNVRFRTFGDDIVITVSDDVKDRFNFNTVQQVLASIGQIATPAAKIDGISPDFIDEKDVTFLKRRFEKRDGIIIAPLSKTAIQSCFGWSQVSAGEVEIWSEIVKCHLEEAVLHGKEYYDYFCDRLSVSLRFCKNKALKQLVVPQISVSYEVAWRAYLDKYVGYKEEHREQMAGLALGALGALAGSAPSKKKNTNPSVLGKATSEIGGMIGSLARSTVNALSKTATKSAVKPSRAASRPGAFPLSRGGPAKFNLAGVTTKSTSTDPKPSKLGKIGKGLKSGLGFAGAGIMTSAMKFGVDKFLTQVTGKPPAAPRLAYYEQMAEMGPPKIQEEYSPDAVDASRRPQNIQTLTVYGRTFEDFDIPGITMSVADWSKLALPAFTSEVGAPTDLPWVGGTTVPGFCLRPSMQVPLMHRHMCADIGDFWNYPIITMVEMWDQVRVIDPEIPANLFALCNFLGHEKPFGFSYNVTYIFRIDEPLGSSHVYQFEAHTTPITLKAGNNNRRKVLWSTRDYPIVAFQVGWMSPRPYIADLTATQAGQPDSGRFAEPMSIKVTPVLKNVAQSVLEPMNLVMWTLVTDIKLLGPRYTGEFTNPTIPIGPSGLTPFPTRSEQKAPILAHYEQSAPDSEDPIMAQPVLESVIAPTIEEPSVGVEGALPATENEILGWTNPRWWPLGTATIERRGRVEQVVAGAPFRVWSIEPIRNEGTGESLGKPFHKYVYCTGAWMDGYLVGFEVKIISARNPHTAGILCVYSAAYPLVISHQPTNDIERGMRSYHVFGGPPTVHRVEISANAFTYTGLLPEHMEDYAPGGSTAGLAGYDQMLMPWFRCTQLSLAFAIDCLAINSSDATASAAQQIAVYCRPTFMSFRIPRKPYTGVATRMVEEKKEKADLDIDDLTAAMDTLAHYEQSMVPEARDDSTFMAGGGHEDTTPIDNFWVRAVQGEFLVKVGNGVPSTWSGRANMYINPFLMNDTMGDVETSYTVFREKCERYTGMVPTGESMWGPTYGAYKIVCRAPVNVGFNIAHVCLSQDESDIVNGLQSEVNHPLMYSSAKMFSIGANAVAGQLTDAGVVESPGLGSTGSSDDLPGDMGLIPVDKFSAYMHLGEWLLTQTPTPSNPATSRKWSFLAMQIMDFSVQFGQDITVQTLRIPVTIMINICSARWLWQCYTGTPITRSIVSTFDPFAGAISVKALSHNASLAMKQGNVRLGLILMKRVYDAIQNSETMVRYARTTPIAQGPAATPSELRWLYNRAVAKHLG
uniref:RNA-directed RNA polymerase n=1 Tax=Reticulitermes speratus solinvi-like virus TaxID=3032238 RepID=A0AAT9J9N2_9VIRU